MLNEFYLSRARARIIKWFSVSYRGKVLYVYAVNGGHIMIVMECFDKESILGKQKKKTLRPHDRIPCKL